MKDKILKMANERNISVSSYLKVLLYPILLDFKDSNGKKLRGVDDQSASIDNMKNDLESVLDEIRMDLD